jgi:hypothetical protein
MPNDVAWKRVAMLQSFVFLRPALPRLAFGCLVLMVLGGSANALSLITTDEAAMPDDPVKMRGISRGPKITLVNPAATAGMIRSPFNLRIRFESHGGARIDPDSIVVTYRKRPAIDLTQRMQAFIAPTGISVDSAEIPPGEHHIRVDVKDTDGQASSTEFTITIEK